MQQKCQAILSKLQQQSDILRNMPISVEVTEATENGSVDVKNKLIKVNPQYISGLQVAESTIAHELAHIAYYELYGFKRNKEDELFADVYGMILCKRAGYDISEDMKKWNEKLKRIENTDEHPQNKIRYLIMKRVAAYMDDFNNVKVNYKNAPKPRQDYAEAPFDITLRRERLRKKFGVEDDDVRTKLNPEDIMRDDISVGEFRDKILSADLLGLSVGVLGELSQKILKERKLSQDYKVLVKMYSTLKHVAFENSDDWFLAEKIALYGGRIMQRLNLMSQQQNPQTFRENVETLLWHKHRFTSPRHRKQLQNWYTECLLEQYGKDDGSEKYATELAGNLEKFHNKLHNADVLPLLKNIKDTLQLTDRNILLLQSFAQNNSQETKQIRMEVLATECLLSFDQAVKTVRYLSSNKIKPFRYETFEGKYWYNDYTRRDEPLKTVSFIKEDVLKEIHDDMANINPKKRAEIFCLLLENVSNNDGIGKLELFVAKKAKNDNIYKTLVDEYIKTYEPKQQAYVVASLVSKKKLSKDYSYEDYFKTILENSGIDGIRAYNALYADKRKEEIMSLDTNRTALHSKDMLIFANLRELGQKMAQHSSADLQKIGNKIMQATAKSIAKPLKKEREV